MYTEVMKSKILYILIGPQGSGKTTYVTKTLPGVVRISQDEQGKKGHFEAFEQALKDGQNIVVDRINHIRDQRRRYTEFARQNGYLIHFIWFDSDRQLCMERLAHRKNHPTIKQEFDNHERILSSYFRDFERPEHYEYDEITIITKRKNASLLDLCSRIGDQKYIVVGDIHGCFDELLALLTKCGYRPGDFLISVGDLMDRGPKSRDVIEWFMAAENAFVVEGNHDNKARRYWAGRRVKIAHGLDLTIEQCKDMDTAAVARWIESFPQIIQLPGINGKRTYVVHAGVDGKFQMDRQPLENCLYARYFGGEGFLDQSGDIWYTTLDGSYNVISGHMIHEHVTPTEYGNMDYVFLLDGGAFQGGELRALVVENGEHRIESVQSKCYTVEKVEIDAVAARDELVDQGLLRCDDRGNLRIYNYTDNCTHSAAWSDTTRNSRGIIFNVKTGEVVAQPMPKFFNVGEREETMEKVLPWASDYIVFEKMDGWLGTLYRYDGEYCVATRGSFDGMGMAPWATKFLNQNYDLTGLPDDVTLVFEIICPQTHIIVHYGDREDLILLAAYNRHTGEEYEWAQVTTWAKEFGFSLPRVFGSNVAECRRVLTEHSGTELEGFVIRFANGLRVKIKSEDYKRRAAIISNLTPLAIWKAMRDQTLTDDYRDAIDADYIDLYDELHNALAVQYEKLHDQIVDEYTAIMFEFMNDIKLNVGPKNIGPECAEYRKAFALKAQSSKIQHKSAMFALLDNQKDSIRKYIIKRIRPSHNELDTTI